MNSKKYKPKTTRGWFFGRIPSDWTYVTLKYASDIVSDYGANISANNYIEDGVRFIRTSDIDNNGALLPKGVCVSKKDIEGYILKENDLLISRSGTIGRTFLFKEGYGLCAYAGYLVRFHLTSKYIPEYVFYVTKSVGFQKWLKTVSIEATICNVNGEKYANFCFPSPAFAKQKAIANYLDHEISRIDKLISEKENMLLLMEEKRKTLITHAVTCGLDSNAAMKDSGFDWLGEIPAHWRTERAKNIFSIRDERSEKGDEELLSVSHITGVTSRAEKDVNMFQADDKTGYKRCYPNDFVTNTLWAWMGAMGISHLEGIVSPDYHVYSSKGLLLPEFMELLCRSKSFIAEVNRWSKGVWSSRLRLYPENFFEICLPIPPKREQYVIVEYIKEFNKKTEILEKLLSKSNELLKERRSALITAAVTGQLNIEEVA